MSSGTDERETCFEQTEQVVRRLTDQVRQVSLPFLPELPRLDTRSTTAAADEILASDIFIALSTYTSYETRSQMSSRSPL